MTTQNTRTRAPLTPKWAFVVQLREGTSFASGDLCGRIEHVSSGQACLFESLEQARLFMAHVIAAMLGSDA